MEKNQITLEELKIEYTNKLKDFFDTISPYDYDNDTWEAIKYQYSITYEKIEAIDNDNSDKFKQYYNEYLDEFKKFIKESKTLKSEKKSSREVFLERMAVIGDKIATGTIYVWNKVKFAFAIPGIVFASFVFTYFITLIFGTFLTWIFPYAYTDAYDGVVNAIIACVIFLILRIAIFKDVYLNHPNIDIKMYLIKHFIAISFWWFIFYFIRYREIDNVFSFTVFDNAIYLPYMPIAAFTGEYFITPLITYFVINVIPFIFMLIYIYFMEKFFTKRKAYQKDSDIRIQEDYDYHFDINSHVEIGNNIDEVKEVNQEEESNN